MICRIKSNFKSDDRCVVLSGSVAIAGGAVAVGATAAGASAYNLLE